MPNYSTKKILLLGALLVVLSVSFLSPIATGCATSASDEITEGTHYETVLYVDCWNWYDIHCDNGMILHVTISYAVPDDLHLSLYDHTQDNLVDTSMDEDAVEQSVKSKLGDSGQRFFIKVWISGATYDVDFTITVSIRNPVLVIFIISLSIIISVIGVLVWYRSRRQ